MNDKALFELFKRVHREEGTCEEFLICERWRLMQPLRGMNDKKKDELEAIVREYVRSLK
jgi:hypothetical protein